MNRSVFRAALRASAKVALGAAVVGCGGVVGSAAEHAPQEASTSDTSPVSDASQMMDAAASETGVPLEAGACDPPSPSSVLPEGAHADAAAAISASTFDCCVARLEAVPPDDAGFFPDAAVGDPLVQDCCATIIARLDYELRQTIGDPDAAAAAQQDEQTAAPVRWQCCQVTPSEGPTCTPWGPPMPPAMPGEVA
jgi:hypothetical protein